MGGVMINTLTFPKRPFDTRPKNEADEKPKDENEASEFLLNAHNSIPQSHDELIRLIQSGLGLDLDPQPARALKHELALLLAAHHKALVVLERFNALPDFN